jgi:hypothetical protein
MRDLGYFFSPIYCESSCTVPMSETVWLTLFGSAVGVNVLDGYIALFLAGVRSPRHRNVIHTVGIALHAVNETGLTVQVFDPGAAGEKEYPTLAAFLASPLRQGIRAAAGAAAGAL